MRSTRPSLSRSRIEGVFGIVFLVLCLLAGLFGGSSSGTWLSALCTLALPLSLLALAAVLGWCMLFLRDALCDPHISREHALLAFFSVESFLYIALCTACVVFSAPLARLLLAAALCAVSVLLFIHRVSRYLTIFLIKIRSRDLLGFACTVILPLCSVLIISGVINGSVRGICISSALSLSINCLWHAVFSGPLYRHTPLSVSHVPIRSQIQH